MCSQSYNLLKKSESSDWHGNCFHRKTGINKKAENNISGLDRKNNEQKRLSRVLSRARKTEIFFVMKNT